MSFALMALWSVAGLALAQSVSDALQNASPEQRRLLEQYQRGQQSSPQSNQGSTSQTPTPPTTIAVVSSTTPPQTTPPQTSPVERTLSLRAGQTLRLFGYDQVGIGASVTVPSTGGVRDDYILGPGDQIVVVLRGQENSEYSAIVDRNGQLALPKVGPIPAAGRTLGSFRTDLQAMVRNAFASTTAFVSVGQLRQVSVMVTGEVDSPGTRIMTGLSTVLDALKVSGGVKKSGTLRDIRLIRGTSVVRVDLYTLLSGKSSSRIPLLQDGDRIFVGPIGATVGIGGYVRRPAIYELLDGQRSIGAAALISLANGQSTRGPRTVSLQRTLPDGTQRYLDISGQPNRAVDDSEVIVVRTGPDTVVGRVDLLGAVRTPGGYAIDKYRTLQDLLPSTEALVPGAYLLFGYVIRTDHANLTRGAVAFSPLRVIQKRENLVLTSDDAVVVLSRETAQDLIGIALAAPRSTNLRARLGGAPSAAAANNAVAANTDALQPGASPAANPTASLLIPRTANTARDGNQAAPGSTFPSAMTGPQSQSAATAGPGSPSDADAAAGANAAPPSGDFGGLSLAETATIGRKLRDYQVTFSGALNGPGTYLVAPNTSVADALSAIGGLVSDTDLQSFEITSTKIDNAQGTSTTVRAVHQASEQELARIVLNPYDRVEFRQVYSDRSGGSVTVDGEVRYPGSFNILRNEKLSSVLRRAGGLTEAAYPEGAVFRRESVAAAEVEENQRIAADLRSQYLAVLMRPPSGSGAAPTPSADSMQALLGLMSQVDALPGIGRVPVVADLAELEIHPELDTLLEPGDVITFPKRPATVLVMGEVLRPGAQRFTGVRSAEIYVERAGGSSQHADTSRIIVVLPDGSVRNNDSSWLNFGDAEIPPGSTIFVPRDLEEYPGHMLLIDVLQVFSQLATTAASIAVLSK